jgi:hypothetical protein
MIQADSVIGCSAVTIRQAAMTYFRQMMKNYRSQNKENLLAAKRLDVLHRERFEVIIFVCF